MPKGWSKGFTKETHPSILKISKTMKERGIDNFVEWRKRMKKAGRIRDSYPTLIRNGDLAELIGVVLGDGCIRKYDRVDELSIFSNTSNLGFVGRYSKLVEKIFDKKPAVSPHGRGCTRIRIYQKKIQSRIGIPYSPRRDLEIKVPGWILKNKEFVVRYLRGLYEAEGSISHHSPTYTHKLIFTNCNRSMLDNVFKLLVKLGFHPHTTKGSTKIQLSKKEEIEDAMKLLQFRKY